MALQAVRWTEEGDERLPSRHTRKDGFQVLEGQGVGKVLIGCDGSFSDILATFKEIPLGPSDPRTS